MRLEKRAVFNLLRMNWEMDPSFPVESWQVEDYRALPIHALFHRCHQLGVSLDQKSFRSFASRFDSPEELTAYLIEEVLETEDLETKIDNQLYLPVFELWRRLVPEKQPLSIFCDELDHQIYQYDHAKSQTLEPLQDALSSLLLILEENAEVGNPSREVFAYIASECANDLESFLFDFIDDLLEENDVVYASELVEGFLPYVFDPKWFEFLQVRILFVYDPLVAGEQFSVLLRKARRAKDLEFDFELLSFMVLHGERALFEPFARHCVSLLENEVQFQDLLIIASDFYRCLDQEGKEKQIEELLQNRASIASESNIVQEDQGLKVFLQLLRAKDEVQNR